MLKAGDLVAIAAKTNGMCFVVVLEFSEGFNFFVLVVVSLVFEVQEKVGLVILLWSILSEELLILCVPTCLTL